MDFATFRDGSWPDQVRIFLDGLRTCATRLPELGAGSGQVQAFCDMLDQVEGRLNEEGPPSEERKVTVIPPSNRLPSKAEIARGFSAMRRKDAAVDRDTMRISDPARRIAGFRLTAESKTYLSDRYADAPLYYRNYRSGTESEDFRALGPASEDAAVRAVQEAAHRSVARLAAEFGLDPDATIARFADDRVSIGLGRDFRKAELRERAETRARRGEKPESRKESNAQIDAFHQQARMIFQEAILKVQDV
ncbi:hypothetical protein [Amaricoccus sp.]|uniref:hypothetical protein n=1 Tax=Amaricoccus sp. TaxID=1872485 RepID=UPI001B5D4E2A|nr:hypothetical protein [Amaricoccus sp.]MBP7002073.1 hypothetical protein [Amaricoccus sp.]